MCVWCVCVCECMCVNELGELYFSIDIIHPCPRALEEDDGNCSLLRKGLRGIYNKNQNTKPKDHHHHHKAN